MLFLLLLLSRLLNGSGFLCLLPLPYLLTLFLLFFPSFLPFCLSFFPSAHWFTSRLFLSYHSLNPFSPPPSISLVHPSLHPSLSCLCVAVPHTNTHTYEMSPRVLIHPIYHAVLDTLPPPTRTHRHTYMCTTHTNQPHNTLLSQIDH